MPAMSPFATTGGTIRKWNKKEGEEFVAGDVLLQIESEFGRLNVEAERSGIMGKILFPDGTSDIPVEKVIALVATDARELASFQAQQQPRMPTPPPPPPLHISASPRPQLPPSRTSTPVPQTDQSKPHLMPASRRGPSGYDKEAAQATGASAVRGMVIDHATYRPALGRFPDSKYRATAGPDRPDQEVTSEQIKMAGEAIRRKIVSNLSSSPRNLASLSSSTKTCATTKYFEGII